MAHRLTVEIGMKEIDAPIVKVTLDGRVLDGVEAVTLETMPGGLTRVGLTMIAIAKAEIVVPAKREGV